MKPLKYDKRGIQIYCGDGLNVLKCLDDESVNCCVTSPPYWGLRDYGHDGQLGLESTPEEYVGKMVNVFREVRRLLRDDGTLWLNLGDSYNAGRNGGHPGGKKQWKPEQKKHQSKCGVNAPGLKPKDLVGIPWRVAFALQADGWYLRQDIIWHKPNPMPESVTDRCTKAHEYIFLLSKSKKYYYNHEAIKEQLSDASVKRGPVKLGGQKGVDYTPEDGDPNFRNGNEQWGREMDFSDGGTRNKRSVWTVTTTPYKEAHFAVFPEALIDPCIKAGCPEGGTVLDPFAGSGTTLKVAAELGCKAIGIELNPEYIKMIKKRLPEPGLGF